MPHPNQRPPAPRRLRDSPCHGCVAPKRHPGCHDHCKEYADWTAGNERDKNALKKYEDRYYKTPRIYLFKFKKG